MLAALVDEALDRNQDLRGAAARVRRAAAQRRLAGAAEQPSIDAGANASRRGSSNDGERRVTSSSFEAKFDLTWEADVWGRLADATRAAALDERAARADLEAARLSLAASVARAWYDAVEAHLQAELARDTVANFERNLEVVEDGFRSGLGAALDVRLERANLASARAQLAARENDLDRAVRVLEVLLGRYPGGRLDVVDDLPRIAGAVPAGLPSDLLARRPDLAAAMRRLEASNARVREAEKARMPSFRLSGSGGLGSSELRNLLDLDSILWSLVVGVVAPVIDAGRIEARVAIESARTEEALASFAGQLLVAFQEVETALAAEGRLARREEALRAAADEATRAAELALERYRRGLVGIVTWLDARGRAFTSRSTLLAVANQRIQNRIRLHLALGGSFDAGPARAAVPDPGSALDPTPAPTPAPTSAPAPSPETATLDREIPRGSGSAAAGVRSSLAGGRLAIAPIAPIAVSARRPTSSTSALRPGSGSSGSGVARSGRGPRGARDPSGRDEA